MAAATDAMAGPAVDLDGVAISFKLARGGSYPAVSATQLHVKAGEFVAVVGPTGCGKSTLLNVAAGLGYLIQQAEGVFDVTGVFAGMVVLTAFVLIIDGLVTWVENRLLGWRPVTGQSTT